jgi:hypothetical protein
LTARRLGLLVGLRVVVVIVLALALPAREAGIEVTIAFALVGWLLLAATTFASRPAAWPPTGRARLVLSAADALLVTAAAARSPYGWILVVAGALLYHRLARIDETAVDAVAYASGASRDDHEPDPLVILLERHNTQIGRAVAVQVLGCIVLVLAGLPLYSVLVLSVIVWAYIAYVLRDVLRLML